MLGLYVFSLVLGGGFLAFSLLGDGIGGGHHDVGWDGGGVGDASGVDDGFLDGHDLHASKIFSLRMVIYGLFGFGAVGTVLSLAGPGGALALFSALAGGLASPGLPVPPPGRQRGARGGRQLRRSGRKGDPSPLPRHPRQHLRGAGEPPHRAACPSSRDRGRR